MSPVSVTPHALSPPEASAPAHEAMASPGGAPGAARRRPPATSSLAQVGPLRILVVEPDARTRSLLEVGLSRNGFEVIVARTLEEAQELVAPGRPLPSMLVCETDLAGEDGFRFCGQLRADLRTAQIPVVLLS